ncbi:MAG: OmpA family protein, partial [Gammaproteobacteria bacterium]|nr:OmpA family protein [Gammaproteobacteria bacterium]
LETAVRGSGAMGGLFVVALALIALIRHAKMNNVKPMLVAVVVLVVVPGTDAKAESVCGHYTERDRDRVFYEGDDPERDEAGFGACWYGGIGLGYSYVAPEKEAQNFLLDKDEDHDSGYHVFVGKQFTPHWFAEFKYADLGEAGITNRNPAIAALYPDAAITYKVPSLMVGYQWRETRRLKPFAKVGISAIGNNAKGGPIPFEKQTSVQLAFAAGLEYHFGRSRWFLRGDVDWYDRDAWYLGVSVARFFGGESEDAPRVVQRPEVDTDGDGVLDEYDRCPDTPAGAIVDGNGCPVPADGDKDGVIDEEDQCPATEIGASVDSKGCAVPADGDKDGVIDEEDQCPATEIGAPIDNRGCEIKDEIRLPGVTFETNSDRLRPSSAQVLEDAAETLKRNPDLIVEVAGYTDSLGEASYNLGLSERRAKTVRNHLIGRGVDESRMSWRGYGEEQPVADNSTAEGREENRRVVLRILQH